MKAVEFITIIKSYATPTETFELIDARDIVKGSTAGVNIGSVVNEDKTIVVLNASPAMMKAMSSGGVVACIPDCNEDSIKLMGFMSANNQTADATLSIREIEGDNHVVNYVCFLLQ